jgi:hypothetical protein
MRERGSSRRGSPLLGLLLFAATLAAAGYFWLKDADSRQRQRITYLEGLSSRLQAETVPIRFMILSRDGGAIKARIKLYDLAGSEVAVIEKSWPGAELYVDTLLVPLGGDRAGSGRGESWLAFPYRIFTDRVSASAGTLLFDAYDGGGFPEVFRGIAWTDREAAALRSVFAAARKEAAAGLPATGSAKGAFGAAAHEVEKLAGFELGVVYKVVCRSKGGVEIMED